MNNCIFTGGITRDAELKYTNSGVAVCKFGFANTTGFGDKKRTNYFDMVLWGKRAEGLAQHLEKGKQLIVSAEARYSTWEKDGMKHNKIDFHVDKLDFQMGNKPDGQQSNQPQTQQQPPKVQTDNQGPPDFVDDDLPF